MSVKQPRTRKFMAHDPGFTIIDAMNRLFPAWLARDRTRLPICHRGRPSSAVFRA